MTVSTPTSNASGTMTASRRLFHWPGDPDYRSGAMAVRRRLHDYLRPFRDDVHLHHVRRAGGRRLGLRHGGQHGLQLDLYAGRSRSARRRSCRRRWSMQRQSRGLPDRDLRLPRRRGHPDRPPRPACRTVWDGTINSEDGGGRLRHGFGLRLHDAADRKPPCRRCPRCRSSPATPTCSAPAASTPIPNNHSLEVPASFEYFNPLSGTTISARWWAFRCTAAWAATPNT